jgi:hypothetical protein
VKSSKSAIISHLISFSALKSSFCANFYPQIRISILIPQYSPQNKPKSPYKSAIATYGRDF